MIFILLLLILNLNFINSLFNPTIKLNSGKKAKIIGKGPPIFFSPGLFGTMPTFLYSNLINNLKKNLTVVVIDDLRPININDLNDITHKLSVDTIAYLSHSSFFPKTLESNVINSAILLDPICLPNINFNGINNPSVSLNYPVHIIRAEKLYNTDVPLPEWQELEIYTSNIIDETYNSIGHPDILDDIWADLAKSLDLWDTADNKIVSFKEWKFINNRNDIKKIRKEYRNYVCERINLLINDILL